MKRKQRNPKRTRARDWSWKRKKAKRKRAWMSVRLWPHRLRHAPCGCSALGGLTCIRHGTETREPKKEWPVEVKRRQETLYLYGTDKMSTEDVFKYFVEYKPQFVEWIDDSSCNVVFDDHGCALSFSLRSLSAMHLAMLISTNVAGLRRRPLWA
jgi:hypothetical protein